MRPEFEFSYLQFHQDEWLGWCMILAIRTGQWSYYGGSVLVKRGGNLTKNYFATDRSVGKCAQLEFSCTHFRGHFKAHLILAQKTLKDLGSISKKGSPIGDLKFVEILNRRRWTLFLKIDPMSFRVFCPKLAEKWPLKWAPANSNFAFYQPPPYFCVDSKHLLTFDQLTCTLAGSSQQDWKGTLDCWGTCRTYGPSLFWALGGRGGQGQEPERGESSLHRHRPGPGKRGSKSAGTSVHSYWQTTC